MNLFQKFVSVAILLFSGVVAAAQVATGVPLYGTFAGGPFDSINLGNLNVHLSIPIIHRAGRGLDFDYKLSYDSSVWAPVTTTVNGVSMQQWNNAANWGWTAGNGPVFGYVNANATQSTTTSDSCTTTLTTNTYTYTDIGGTVHPFAGTTSSTSNSCGGTTNSADLTAKTQDGSAYTLTATAKGTYKVTASSGHQLVSNCTYYIAQWLPCTQGVRTDTNGNQLTVNSNGEFFDTLSETTPVLTQTGLGTPASPIILAYTGPTGTKVFYQINFTSYTVQTAFNINGILEYRNTANLVSSIDLPDGVTHYYFSYEETPGTCAAEENTSSACITGRITKVTLPTGGSISYIYGGGPSETGIFSDGSTSTLTRVVSPGGLWQYVRQSPSGEDCKLCDSTTTTTDPLGNQTVSAFKEYALSTGQDLVNGTWTTVQLANPIPNMYMTKQVVYDGELSGNHVLKTTVRTYPAGFPVTGITTVTTLPSGQSRSSTVTYNGGYPGSGLVDSILENDFNYQTLSYTTIGYATLDNGIIDKPSIVMSLSSENVGSPIVAYTKYSYDDYSIVGTFLLPQHVGISGSRGNLTSVSRMTGSSSYLTSTYRYYDTGLVYQSYDVNTTSKPTTFTYGYCANAFPSNITGPTGLSTQATWDCNGGVQLTSVDPNNQTTKVVYTDPYYWRPTSTVDAELNAATISYSAFNASPVTIESSMQFNSNASATDVLTSLDPFGRTLTTQVRQSPGASTFDTTSYGYDLLGRQTYHSLPYSAGASFINTSGPGSTISYDALSRTTGVSDSGGGYISYSYASGNNDALAETGPAPGCENPKQRQIEYDGLGRISSVCEVSSALPGVGACSQNASTTGYWTKYTYGIYELGQLTKVTQNAQAATASQQSRGFGYDMAGRLTSEQNAENGLTSYTYDSDPQGKCASFPGDLIKKVDANGTITCIAYDLLHRPTAITYPVVGPGVVSTPAKYFVYDSASVNGVSLTNAQGRLVEAYTMGGSGKLTDVFFGYSPRGETTDVYQSTPNSNGFVHISATYWANGAPASLSGVPASSPVSFTYGVDGEGRTSTVSTKSGSPSSLISAVTYNPSSQVTSLTYGTGDTDTFLYDPRTGRTVGYQYLLVGSAPVVGSLTWNPDGSLKSMATFDPFNSANTQNCTYSNDDLGRLASANCTSQGTAIWNQAFTYDSFGNLSKSGTQSFMPGYDSLTNRISSAIPNVQYDNAGNLLSINTDTQHMYTWDAANSLATVDSASNTRDALGRVVEQLNADNSGAYTQTVYTPWGEKLALVGAGVVQKAFIALPGGATAVYKNLGLAYFRHPDWLGSSRFASTPTHGVYYSGAYAPFGESYSENSVGGTDRSFTGQNQDTESGLYDFPTRGYSPGQGRWLSPDIAGLGAVKLENPQSWNRYAYAKNKPLRSVDPLGQVDMYFCTGNCDDSSDDSSNDSENDSMWDDFTNGFEDFFQDLFSFFGGGGGGRGGRDSTPPPQRVQSYEQSSVSSSAVHSVSMSTSYSGPVNGDPDLRLPANNALPQGGRYVDPFFAAIEFKAKLGPEVQVGPVKAGVSMYWTVNTGDTGADLDLNAGVASIQAENATPDGAHFGGGGPGNTRWSGSIVGFQYDVRSGTWKFNPTKSFKLGLQAILGFEVGWNSDTYSATVAHNRYLGYY